MKIVLASKSPRRRELLGKLVSDFEIITRETDETLPKGVHPSVGVEILAIRKGESVARELDANALVVSSDTLVELDGIPLGKPIDEGDAVRMLSELSGRTHHVHTGVAIHYKKKVFSGVDSAAVTFREISKEEISEYITGGEPMDKAGAYAIQGGGAKFVEKYEGEFDAIVGLGLKLTKKLIDMAVKDD